MIIKPKNRYLLVESSSPLDTSNRAVAEKVLDAIAFEIGALGYVRANPKIVQQVGNRAFIIRVNRGWEGDLVLALSFIKRVGDMKVGFYTIKTSGTIRKLASRFKSVNSSKIPA